MTRPFTEDTNTKRMGTKRMGTKRAEPAHPAQAVGAAPTVPPSRRGWALAGGFSLAVHAAVASVLFLGGSESDLAPGARFSVEVMVVPADGPAPDAADRAAGDTGTLPPTPDPAEARKIPAPTTTGIAPPDTPAAKITAAEAPAETSEAAPDDRAAAPGPDRSAEAVRAAQMEVAPGDRGDAVAARPDGPARALFQPLPTYPRSARRLGQEGRVLLHVTVGTDGRAANVSVAQSSGVAALDRAALEAVRRWTFVPAAQDGAAAGRQIAVPVMFRLEN